MPLAPSLDHAGPLARTPSDVACCSPSSPARAGDDDSDAPCETGLEGVKVAVCPDLHLVRLTPDVQRAFDAAVAAARRLGAEIVEVPFPAAARVLPAFAAIQMTEALRTHRVRGLYPARLEEYGDDVRVRLERAAQVTADDYLDAVQDREAIRASFARLLADADFLLTPVSAVPVPRRDEERFAHFGETAELRDLVMGFTVPQNLAGVPSCTVCAGSDRHGLPIGVQLTAAWWREEPLLEAAGALWAALATERGQLVGK